MHGTQAHVLIDGRIACTGDEAVFFDIIQKNGFKYNFSLAIIPSYFRHFSCTGKCDTCPEKERHDSTVLHASSPVVIHQELESKRNAKLDAFLNSSSQPAACPAPDPVADSMEEEPTKGASLLAVVDSIADDSFLTETATAQATVQATMQATMQATVPQGGVVKIDVNDAGMGQAGR